MIVKMSIHLSRAVYSSAEWRKGC